MITYQILKEHFQNEIPNILIKDFNDSDMMEYVDNTSYLFFSKAYYSNAELNRKFNNIHREKDVVVLHRKTENESEILRFLLHETTHALGVVFNRPSMMFKTNTLDRYSVYNPEMKSEFKKHGTHEELVAETVAYKCMLHLGISDTGILKESIDYQSLHKYYCVDQFNKDVEQATQYMINLINSSGLNIKKAG